MNRSDEQVYSPNKNRYTLEEIVGFSGFVFMQLFTAIHWFLFKQLSAKNTRKKGRKLGEKEHRLRTLVFFQLFIFVYWFAVRSGALLLLRFSFSMNNQWKGKLTWRVNFFLPRLNSFFIHFASKLRSFIHVESWCISGLCRQCVRNAIYLMRFQSESSWF